MNFKKRKLTEYELTKDELDKFRSISVRMDNIETTINTAAKDSPEAFWSAAFKHKDGLSVELRDWWTEVQGRLHSPDEARCDPNAGCLFVLVDANGNIDSTSSVDTNAIDWE